MKPLMLLLTGALIQLCKKKKNYNWPRCQHTVWQYVEKVINICGYSSNQTQPCHTEVLRSLNGHIFQTNSIHLESVSLILKLLFKHLLKLSVVEQGKIVFSKAEMSRFCF